MIEGLRTALDEHDLPALPELEIAVGDALGDPRRPARIVAVERLKSRVFRIRVAIMNEVRPLVIKCMEPQPARRNELAIRRWLPCAGLTGITPALLGIGARRAGGWVWHVYEDLGPGTLDPGVPDHPGVARAIELIASIHARFAAHPMLAECRLEGQDLGISFYSGSVRDAIRNLEALVPPLIEVTAAEAAIRDRLLGRLRRLRDEEPERARALAKWGGPETFLHGDLWTTNAFVEPTADGPRVRFIDWDRAGVGPACYDLSTFLMRFAPGHRASILDRYRRAAEGGLWRMPDTPELNLLFETAEFARYANMAIWPAAWLRRERAAWGFDQLGEVDRWFEAFQSVVPDPQPSRTQAQPCDT